MSKAYLSSTPPEEPPPSYQDVMAETARSDAPLSSAFRNQPQSQLNNLTAGERASSNLPGASHDLRRPQLSSQRADSIAGFKPVVIPQTTTRIKDKFISPFARAYPPEMASLMNKDIFLDLVDNINQAFLASPIFQFAKPEELTLHDYVNKVNQGNFRPLGLKIRVVSTKEMMKDVGMPEKTKLKIPDLPEYDENWDPKAPEWDPRRRRLAALSSYVADLDWDVPPPKTPDKATQQFGAWLANLQEQKQRRRQEVRTDLIHKRQGIKASRHDRKSSRSEAKRVKAAARLERRGNTPRAQAKYERKMAKIDRKEARREGWKSTKDGWKAARRRRSHQRREDKWLQRVRWIVIDKFDWEAVGGDVTRGDEIDTGIERVETGSSSSFDTDSLVSYDSGDESLESYDDKDDEDDGDEDQGQGQDYRWVEKQKGDFKKAV